MTTRTTPTPAEGAAILAAAAEVMRAYFGGLGTPIAVLDEKAAVLAAWSTR